MFKRAVQFGQEGRADAGGAGHHYGLEVMSEASKVFFLANAERHGGCFVIPIPHAAVENGQN